MESGGVSKSMSNLLHVIDTNRFEIFLFLLNPTGVFMELLPRNITIISDFKTQCFFSKFPNNIVKLLKYGFFLAAIARLFAALMMFFNKGVGARLLSKQMFKINERFDLAVDFNGQQQLYYLVDYVDAKVKVSFFHSDYSQWDYYYSMDKKYYSKVDKIFTISETCIESLKKYFPNQTDKINLFENISSVELIEKLAKRSLPKLHQNALVSIGHLTEKKGTLIAFDVAKILKNQGIDFKWYFVGENSNDNDYVALAEKLGITNQIVLEGAIANPYPFIKNAAIIVHLSFFEGKSIALDEAKLLCKPIVVTNFSTVNDQFKNNFNATITNHEPKIVAKNIIYLLKNIELQELYSQNLLENQKSNENEIQKLYKLI